MACDPVAGPCGGTDTEPIPRSHRTWLRGSLAHQGDPPDPLLSGVDMSGLRSWILAEMPPTVIARLMSDDRWKGTLNSNFLSVLSMRRSCLSVSLPVVSFLKFTPARMQSWRLRCSSFDISKLMNNGDL